MTKKSTPIIAQTPPSLVAAPAIEFRKNDFEQAIWTKGYRVIHEKALKCPCKSKNSNQQSNCKNCGGTAWIFINPVETRAILHSMNRDTQFKEWSEEDAGNVNISMMDKDNLSFMDRITLEDARAVFSQALHFKEKDGILFTYAAYNIKEVSYMGLFIDVDSKLQRLEEGTDYTLEETNSTSCKGIYGNTIFLNEKYTSMWGASGEDLSITIRYIHAPQFYVVDLKREVMTTLVKNKGKEESISMPVSAVGRRGHYILDKENLSETRLVDNSFNDECKT